MRYYLKIEDYVFPNVSEMEITSVYRKESIQQNLAGGYLIDRGGTPKVMIKAKLNLLTRSEMVDLRFARDKLSIAVEYERTGAKYTAQMTLREYAEPSPVKTNPHAINQDPDTDYDYYYPTVNIVLEEL